MKDHYRDLQVIDRSMVSSFCFVPILDGIVFGNFVECAFQILLIFIVNELDHNL